MTVTDTMMDATAAAWQAEVPALLLPRLRRADEANVNADSHVAPDGGQGMAA